MRYYAAGVTVTYDQVKKAVRDECEIGYRDAPASKTVILHFWAGLVLCIFRHNQ